MLFVSYAVDRQVDDRPTLQPCALKSCFSSLRPSEDYVLRAR